MNTCKFVLLLVVVVSCWNCAESELGIEEEMLPDAELYLFPRDVKVTDLLEQGYLDAWGNATFTILSNDIGNKLLRYVKALSPNRAFIRFEAIPGEDGLPDMTKETMTYAGYGLIRYTGKVLRNGCKDELLFHEFFHVFQNGLDAPPRKSVNNELEACLAQYFYSDSKSSDSFAVVIDPKFRPKLVALASCIDSRTGYLKVSCDEFYMKYVEALNFIADTPPYNGSGWIRDQAGYNEQPFPKLFQLLNQQS